MANIRIDADGLQNNISSMRAYINELDSLNARTQTLMTQIASSWEGEASTAYRKWEKKSKKVKAKSKKKKDGFLDSLKADMAGVSKAIVKKGKKTVAKIKKSYDEKGFVYKALQYGKSAVKVGAGVVKIAGGSSGSRLRWCSTSCGCLYYFKCLQ